MSEASVKRIIDELEARIRVMEAKAQKNQDLQATPAAKCVYIPQSTADPYFLNNLLLYRPKGFRLRIICGIARFLGSPVRPVDAGPSSN